MIGSVRADSLLGGHVIDWRESTRRSSFPLSDHHPVTILQARLQTRRSTCLTNEQALSFAASHLAIRRRLQSVPEGR